MIRSIVEEDVEYILNLYTKYPDFPKPERSLLPGNGTDGWCYEVDGKIVAATYAYLSANAPVAWLEWTVSDRDYIGRDKPFIVVELLQRASKELQDCGYKMLFAVAGEKQRLIGIYNRAGFEKIDDPMYELVKYL